MRRSYLNINTLQDKVLSFYDMGQLANTNQKLFFSGMDNNKLKELEAESQAKTEFLAKKASSVDPEIRGFVGAFPDAKKLFDADIPAPTKEKVYDSLKVRLEQYGMESPEHRVFANMNLNILKKVYESTLARNPTPPPPAPVPALVQLPAAPVRIAGIDDLTRKLDEYITENRLHYNLYRQEFESRKASGSSPAAQRLEEMSLAPESLIGSLKPLPKGRGENTETQPSQIPMPEDGREANVMSPRRPVSYAEAAGGRRVAFEPVLSDETSRKLPIDPKEFFIPEQGPISRTEIERASEWKTFKDPETAVGWVKRLVEDPQAFREVMAGQESDPAARDKANLMMRKISSSLATTSKIEREKISNELEAVVKSLSDDDQSRLPSGFKDMNDPEKAKVLLAVKLGYNFTREHTSAGKSSFPHGSNVPVAKLHENFRSKEAQRSHAKAAGAAAAGAAAAGAAAAGSKDDDDSFKISKSRGRSSRKSYHK